MGEKRVTKLQERLLECNFGEAWQIVTQAGKTMYPHLVGIVWETFIRHKKQMDKTLAFNEITPLPYCFKVLQTCFFIAGIWYWKRPIKFICPWTTR